MLNNIFESPVLKNSKIILEFLYMSDEKNFKNKMKEYDKKSKPASLEEIENDKGEVF